MQWSGVAFWVFVMLTVPRSLPKLLIMLVCDISHEINIHEIIWCLCFLFSFPWATILFSIGNDFEIVLYFRMCAGTYTYCIRSNFFVCCPSAKFSEKHGRRFLISQISITVFSLFVCAEQGNGVNIGAGFPGQLFFAAFSCWQSIRSSRDLLFGSS